VKEKEKSQRKGAHAAVRLAIGPEGGRGRGTVLTTEKRTCGNHDEKGVIGREETLVEKGGLWKKGRRAWRLHKGLKSPF